MQNKGIKAKERKKLVENFVRSNYEFMSVCDMSVFCGLSKNTILFIGEQLGLTFPGIETISPPPREKISVPEKKKPVVKKKACKPEIVLVPDHIIPARLKEPPQRPPAVYTNIPSPFGLADELHGKILKQ